jgi:hypothetical protein
MVLPKKPRGYKPGFCLTRVAEVHGNRTNALGL